MGVKRPWWLNLLILVAAAVGVYSLRLRLKYPSWTETQLVIYMTTGQKP